MSDCYQELTQAGRDIRDRRAAAARGPADANGAEKATSLQDEG